MPIIEVKPKPHTQSVTPEAGYQLVLKEDWIVRVSGGPAQYTSWNPGFFVGDPLFPAVGAAHASNPAFRFRTFGSMKFEKSSDHFLFQGMEFSTSQREAILDFQPNRYDGNSTNPLNADKSWHFDQLKEVVEKARVSDSTATRPLPDSAFSADPEPVAVKETGEAIIGLTRTKYIPVCTYVRNELVVPATLVTEPLIGIVNLNVVTIDGLTCPIGTVLVKDVKVSNHKTGIDPSGGQFKFRTVTYQLAVNKEGWDADVVQRGYYEIVPEDLAAVPPVPRHKSLIRVSDGKDINGKDKPKRVVSVPQFIAIDGASFITNPDDPAYSAAWKSLVHSRVYRHLIYKDFSTVYAVAFA